VERETEGEGAAEYFRLPEEKQLSERPERPIAPPGCLPPEEAAREEEGRKKKEEGRRKKEEGRRKKEEGRRKKEEGRKKKRKNSRFFFLIYKPKRPINM